MHIGWPEGIYLAFSAWSFLTVMAKSTDPVMRVVHVIVTAGTLGVLFWGGFFS